MAGAEVVQNVGDDSDWVNRCDLLAPKESWPNRSVPAWQDTDPRTFADRCNARMFFARTLRPNVRAKREKSV